MMAVSVGTIVLYTLAVSALALTFGVFYPQFGTENAAQIPTSFGGPGVHDEQPRPAGGRHRDRGGAGDGTLRAWQRGDELRATAELLAAGTLVVVICLAATIVPLRLGARRIELMEW